MACQQLAADPHIVKIVTAHDRETAQRERLELGIAARMPKVRASSRLPKPRRA